MAAMVTNHIELTNISEELTQLWNKEQGQKKTRASLFNLILYAQKTSGIDTYQQLIKTVIAKFPCRVMLILTENGGNPYLKTSVRSETLGQGEGQVFCEIIQIEVGGKLIERVPYLILPQILPDLPVYLLWTQDPARESSVLPHLEPLANRIIFDSATTVNLQSYSRAVLSLIHRFHCDIGDLCWSACSGWRDLFVQVFNTSEALHSLTQSKMIRIFYNSRETSGQKYLQAVYFQGWLASRFNWQFQTIENHEGNIRIAYRRPLDEVVVLLIPQEMENLPLGTLLGIEIESARNKGQYNLKRHPQTNQVFVQYSEKDLCHLPYYIFLGGGSEGQEIVNEIFYPSGGKHYRDTLNILSTIAWQNV
jgi:glucose-6-phosphate dehydrogenase assembly protein OpcA